MAMHVTFILPSRGRSGGVRVTVEMAQRLQVLGYKVRIAYPASPPLSLDQVKQKLEIMALELRGIHDHDWLSNYHGPVERFKSLDKLAFAPGEVLIAVGTMMIEALNDLKADVIKVRYCHGFAEDKPELTRRVWGLPMATITVSQTLVAPLEEYSGQKVLAVVPNGLSTEEYFEERLPRDGVGTIYYTHYNKAPELTLALLERLRQRWPAVPQYNFGSPARPREIPRHEYWLLPSIAKVREIYNRSKIWLLASRMEGLPGPVLEAMACGCAVVSTANYGSRELIHDGENGFLVPIGDLEAFMEPVQRLLEDETLRRRIVLNGQRTVREFTWENAVRRMDAFLQSLIHEEAGATDEQQRAIQC